MKVIDLSHAIHAKMPVFPGTEPPVLLAANTLEKDGFIEHKMTLYSHTGTHMDAPAHLLKQGLHIDQFPAGHFIGTAVILDVTDNKTGPLYKKDLIKFEPLIQGVEFVILHTGWSRYWGCEEYFRDYPSLTVEAAEWLAAYNLKGIGIDTISVDDIHSTSFAVHQIFLKRNIVIIENLTNLQAVTEQKFLLSCLPLNIQNGDGSPVRAAAIDLKNNS
jgi:kynurenine formamidase